MNLQQYSVPGCHLMVTQASVLYLLRAGAACAQRAGAILLQGDVHDRRRWCCPASRRAPRLDHMQWWVVTRSVYGAPRAPYICGLCDGSGAEAGPCRACARWPTRDRCHLGRLIVACSSHSSSTNSGHPRGAADDVVSRRPGPQGPQGTVASSSLAQITALGG